MPDGTQPSTSMCPRSEVGKHVPSLVESGHKDTRAGAKTQRNEKRKTSRSDVCWAQLNCDSLAFIELVAFLGRTITSTLRGRLRKPKLTCDLVLVLLALVSPFVRPSCLALPPDLITAATRQVCWILHGCSYGGPLEFSK